jgi:hypothetical protein
VPLSDALQRREEIVGGHHLTEQGQDFLDLDAVHFRIRRARAAT